MKFEVKDCVRCGGNHPAIEFRPLTRPNENWSHWALCPSCEEPILIAVGGKSNVVDEIVSRIAQDAREVPQRPRTPPEASEASQSDLVRQDNVGRFLMANHGASKLLPARVEQAKLSARESLAESTGLMRAATFPSIRDLDL